MEAYQVFDVAFRAFGLACLAWVAVDVLKRGKRIEDSLDAIKCELPGGEFHVLRKEGRDEGCDGDRQG